MAIKKHPVTPEHALCVHLPDRVAKPFLARAKKQGKSVSRAIRDLIEASLEQTPASGL